MMKLEIKGNPNYCCTVAKVDKLIPIEGADKIQKGYCLNTAVVVSKDTHINDVGIFFPVETSLSHDFLRNNNLYKDKEQNVNRDKAGFFETNCRIKCMKLRGQTSEGLFIHLSSLEYLGIDPFKLNPGDEFDHINEIEICRKYIPKKDKTLKETINKKGKAPKKVRRVSKLVENQFRLHYNTSKLRKNLHLIDSNSIITISDKWHGTSLVVSNILVKRKLSLKDKIAKFFGVNVIETEYDKIYSSRSVVKNEYENISSEQNPNMGYYNEDIWGKASEIVFPLLRKGMSAYCEIVGYLSDNREIQKHYNYGCESGTFKVKVYRITLTNEDGKVIEMPFMQMKSYCESVGLETVPLIYYGYAKHYISESFETEDEFRWLFLTKLDSEVQNKKCEYNNKVPKEGYVIKIDGINESSAFKHKNIAFLEYETKLIDNGESDIETNEND
jgi:hypothetical protein